MRKPVRLMFHKMNWSKPIYSKKGGAKTPDAYELQEEDIPCFIQDATSEIVLIYKQRDEMAKQSCFLIDENVFNKINVSDRITFKNTNYRVLGKTDMCNLSKVFRIDLKEEVA